MAEITVDLIKKLREKTQVGMMDCKKALVAANGDFDQAVEDLRKKGAKVAAKRADNAIENGNVVALTSPDFTSGALVEVGCETDFSANTDNMRQFANGVAQNVLADNSLTTSSDESIAQLMSADSVDTPGQTVQDRLDDIISKITENIKVTRFARFSTDNGIINSYIHAGANLGVMVELAIDGARPADISALTQAARDVCMQVAVNNPLCVLPEQLEASVIDKEKEICAAQLKAEGKPEQMIDKIIPGKLKKFYEQVCLNNQKFIKDDKQTVEQMLTQLGKEAGCSITIKQFVRFAIG